MRFRHRHIDGVALRACIRLVNADPNFTSHTEVINGCSDLFVTVLGERGEHARSAIGVGSLPKGFAVEIEAIIEFSSPHDRHA
nr:RidA family protein [Halomonas sp. hl-4]